MKNILEAIFIIAQILSSILLLWILYEVCSPAFIIVIVIVVTVYIAWIDAGTYI